MNYKHRLLITATSLLISTMIVPLTASSGANKCLYVSSYHRGKSNAPILGVHQLGAKPVCGSLG
jgi:D-tyrosyl-tRNA(Tyr) deacylase